VDFGGLPGGERLMAAPPPSVALLWGDDELAATRAVDRIAEAHAAEGGVPLERWELRGDAASPADLVAQIVERLSTPVLFGGGTLAVVSNVGPLIRKNEHRDALVGALVTIAPGNAIAFVEATPSGTKAPPQKRLADAITAAGGVIREFRSPKGGGLTAFIEAEAREKGVALGAGASKEIASRIGGFVQEGDAERRHQTRVAATELDKLAMYKPGGYIEVGDVRALVAEAVPNSVWAFTDAVGERRVARASELLERMLETTPEPVILNVLHRRIRELLEMADRVAAGEALPAIGRAMKIGSEFRMRNLAAQARAWTVADLHAALDGLLELDAMVKGAPGSIADPSQRRLAFQLWVADRVGR
jgi:DNA polymerase-3 subunit delta